MTEILREAQSRFHEIDRMLESQNRSEPAFYDTLNEATQSAYVVMNEGMCESLSVCHQCAEHRDFLHSMIQILEPLAQGAVPGNEEQKQLERYQSIVKQILERIASFR
jgi:NADH:ubiquinone oxidoreductase subunit F (NADH-binding)